MRSENVDRPDQNRLARLHELIAQATHHARRTHLLLDRIERRLADMDRNSEQNQEAGWRIAA